MRPTLCDRKIRVIWAAMRRVRRARRVACHPAHSLHMYHTPEFQATVLLISGPLASAITLWGMRAPAKHTPADTSEASSTTTPTSL